MDSACDARRGVLGDLRMIRIRIVARERRPVGRRQRYRRRRNGYTGRRGDRGHWHGARGAARQAASRARRAGRRRPRASFRRRRGSRRRRAGARFLRTAGGKAAHPDRSSDEHDAENSRRGDITGFAHMHIGNVPERGGNRNQTRNRRIGRTKGLQTPRPRLSNPRFPAFWQVRLRRHPPAPAFAKAQAAARLLLRKPRSPRGEASHTAKKRKPPVATTVAPEAVSNQ